MNQASKEHQENFRKTWKLRDELIGNPEAEAAFEYAAEYKLTIQELNYVGAIIERIDEAERLAEE